ncbi:hypothetical protein JCM8097_001292 [Rhodosporidiobolus ruineniae]
MSFLGNPFEMTRQKPRQPSMTAATLRTLAEDGDDDLSDWGDGDYEEWDPDEPPVEAMRRALEVMAISSRPVAQRRPSFRTPTSRSDIDPDTLQALRDMCAQVAESHDPQPAHAIGSNRPPTPPELTPTPERLLAFLRKDLAGYEEVWGVQTLRTVEDKLAKQVAFNEALAKKTRMADGWDTPISSGAASVSRRSSIGASRAGSRAGSMSGSRRPSFVLNRMSSIRKPAAQAQEQAQATVKEE